MTWPPWTLGHQDLKIQHRYKKHRHQKNLKAKPRRRDQFPNATRRMHSARKNRFCVQSGSWSDSSAAWCCKGRKLCQQEGMQPSEKPKQHKPNEPTKRTAPLFVLKVFVSLQCVFGPSLVEPVRPEFICLALPPEVSILRKRQNNLGFLFLKTEPKGHFCAPVLLGLVLQLAWFPRFPFGSLFLLAFTYGLRKCSPAICDNVWNPQRFTWKIFAFICRGPV